MTDLSREYGDGLYALCAEEGIAKEVLEQLQALKACFDEQPDFCRLLSNMSLSKQERVGIVDRTLRGQVHPYVLNFLKILCERGALHAFSGCEQAYREQYNRRSRRDGGLRDHQRSPDGGAAQKAADQAGQHDRATRFLCAKRWIPSSLAAYCWKWTASAMTIPCATGSSPFIRRWSASKAARFIY